MNSTKRILVVGIGSPHGDDQAGWRVIEYLQNTEKADPVHFQIAKAPVDLLDWMEGYQSLLICDACHGLDRVGHWNNFPWPSRNITNFETSGTHNFSLPTVLLLAEKLNRLPHHVELWVLEGKPDRIDQPLSPQVEAAIPELAGQIRRTIADIIESMKCTSSP